MRENSSRVCLAGTGKSTCSMEPFTRYYGGGFVTGTASDATLLAASNATLCRDACAASSTCNYYTYDGSVCTSFKATYTGSSSNFSYTSGACLRGVWRGVA